MTTATEARAHRCHTSPVMKTDTEVHCLYCITAYGFRRMVQNPRGEFVCSTCGHLVEPRDAEFRCACARCRSMTVNVVGRAPSTLHR